MDEEFDFDVESSNSEIRYLTIELMKIAVQKGKSFDEVAEEFISNVIKLKDMIEKRFVNVKKPVKAVKHNEGQKY